MQENLQKHAVPGSRLALLLRRSKVKGLLNMKRTMLFGLLTLALGLASSAGAYAQSIFGA